MLSGATLRASAMVGTAVLRIVVSSDSMKNATATSHGKSRLLADPACSIAPLNTYMICFRHGTPSPRRTSETDSKIVRGIFRGGHRVRASACRHRSGIGEDGAHR